MESQIICPDLSGKLWEATDLGNCPARDNLQRCLGEVGPKDLSRPPQTSFEDFPFLGNGPCPWPHEASWILHQILLQPIHSGIGAKTSTQTFSVRSFWRTLRVMDVRAKNRGFSCRPGKGEKLFNPCASGRKGQECPREIRSKKFKFVSFFLP